MKNHLKQLEEAASVLTHHCQCEKVTIDGNRLIGVENWYIMCAPGAVRKSVLPVLWADVVKQAEEAQLWPMMLHVRCGDWACTSLNPWLDESTGFENTLSQPVDDWWLSHGEDVSTAGKKFKPPKTEIPE